MILYLIIFLLQEFQKYVYQLSIKTRELINMTIWLTPIFWFIIKQNV